MTVNAVIATATDGAGYFSNSNDDDPLRVLVQNASPLGSRVGSVDDVADAVEFFTGKLARWISGQQLLISGGAVS
ncbi:MAG TPA: SDR family oxidoreductase [Kribbella sp.]